MGFTLNSDFVGRDACRGDSGGPIWVWDGKPGHQRAVLIGVVKIVFFFTKQVTKVISL
jgi:secreted trypsin-like serine protease